MKMTTFNPVAEAVRNTRGFAEIPGRTFRMKMCWKCQKDKPAHEGKQSFLVSTKGGLNTGNALKKFICLDCLNEKQAKTLEAA